MRRLGFLAAIALAGLGISAYLTFTHYQPAALACSTTSLIDCATVTSSRWSVIPGTDLPVALLGLAFFAVSLGLVAPAMRGADARWLRYAHLAWSAGAVAFVFYLVYAELVLVHRICEWCTVVHVLVGITFLLSISLVQEIGTEESLS